MALKWKTATLGSEGQVFRVLVELQGKDWLSRGQPRPWQALVPSIDRPPRNRLGRAEKLTLERRSIDQFRSTARFFATDGERQSLVDDIVALMVLRHHRVPSRLLDWSASPYIATYFAVSSDDDADGEIWSFSERDYEVEGKKQWKRWPATTVDRSGNPDQFAAGLTAFSVMNPPNWIIAVFYPAGFPRQNAQRAVYTMTARFDVDHGDALRALLRDPGLCQRYVVKAKLKRGLRVALRENYGIWRGALFPDSAGAAETADGVFKQPTPGV